MKGTKSPRSKSPRSKSPITKSPEADEVEACKERLELWERNILCALCVQPALPKLAMQLPRLDPNTLPAQSARRMNYHSLHLRVWPEHPQAAADCWCLARQLAGATLAAAVSSFGISCLRLGPRAGPLLAACASACICTFGLVYVWRQLASAIFAPLSGAIGRVKEAALRAPEAVRGIAVQPIQRLERLIDAMAEEQSLMIDRMRRFEDSLKAMDPTFKVPRPAALKQPLASCRELIHESAGLMKEELLEQLDKSVTSTRVGRLATERAAFNRYVIYLPMAAVLLLNVSLSIVQVMLAAGLADVAAGETPVRADGPQRADLTTVLGPMSRRLRGAAAGVAAASGEGAWGLQQEEVLACLRPAAVQVLLSLAQVMVALAFSRGVFLCTLINRTISDLQVELNNCVNLRVEQVAEFALGPAFAEVKWQAGIFFPKFRECTERLEDAGRLQGLEKQAKRLGF